MADANTSMWKKEISFRRKPRADNSRALELDNAPAHAPEPEKRSVWKKELRLPRRDRSRAGYLAPELYVSSERGKSFWKKDVAFGRKPKADLPATGDVVEGQAGEPANAQQKPSLWKKELGLRRKRRPEPVVREAAGTAAPDREPEPVGVASVEPAPIRSPEPLSRPVLPPVDPELERTPTFDLDDDPPDPVFAASSADPDEFDTHVLASDVSERDQVSDTGPSSSAPFPSAHAGALPERPRASLPPKPFEPQGPFALPRELEDEAESEPAAEVRPPLADERTEKKSRWSGRSRGTGEKVAGGTGRKTRGSKGKGGHKAKRVVGLKIGASQLAAASVSNNGAAELLQVAQEPLESGIVVAGELRDPEALSAALKDFFKKHKLPRKDIRLGLSNNRIGVRLFEISGIEDPEQLQNAIRFRAQETLPIPVEEAVLDYHVVGETVDEDGAVTRRVLLVVAYRDLIDRYVAACRKAGLRLVGIDLEAFALLRALGKAPADVNLEDRVGLVVVSVGHDRSTFAVSDGSVCEFTRVLDWGGYSLDVAIARAFDLTPSEAQPIKLALSLADKSSVPPGLTIEEAVLAREAVGRAVETFARDLVSSLRFYQSQPDSLGIRELVLTGGTAEMPGLASELERLIGVYVRVGDPLARVKVSKRVKEREHIGSLAAAIGLGIED